MDETIKKAYQTGYSKTMFNRKRNIEELKNTNYMIFLQIKITKFRRFAQAFFCRFPPNSARN